MILFSFVFLSSSIFIPYLITGTPIIYQLDQRSIEQIKNERTPFIILVIENYPSQLNEEAISKMASMNHEFSNEVSFGIARESFATPILKEVKLQPPFIVYYYAGSLIYAAQYTDDELALISTLQNWLHGAQHAKTYHDLLNLLGNVPYTLLAHENNIKNAIVMMSKLTQIYGSMEIVTCADTLFKKLNLTSQYAVFNPVDKTIKGFENVNEFYNVSIPHYRIINPGDQIEETVVAIFDYDFSNELQNTLFDLKEKYPQFVFGVVSENAFNLYSLFTSKKVDHFPTYLIYNRDMGYFYPLPNNDTKLTEYVDLVAAEKIQKVYMTEPVPNNTNDDDYFLTKIVGSTYEEFVTDSLLDTVVIYTTATRSPYIFEIYRKVAEALSELSLNMKFGYIDPNINASPKEFPYRATSIHIQLFRKDGASIPMLNIVNYEGILRFLHYFATSGGQIPATNFTKEQSIKEKERLVQAYPYFFEEYTESYNKMFDNIDNRE